MIKSTAVFHESDFSFDNKVVSIGPKIGSGQFSVVYLGKYFGDFVAIKKQTRVGSTIEQYLLRELAVLKHVQHRNLMGYIGAWNEVNDNSDGLCAVYIVTEYCRGGDLLNVLLSNSQLGWNFRIKIATEASSALKHLTDRNIIHRDIKSSNVLLDHNWTCKITDFGMAREVPPEITSLRSMTICGTNEYMAPEMLFDEPYNNLVDIFSFGMVLLEIMARKQVGQDGFAERPPRDGFQLDFGQLKLYLAEDVPPSLEALAIQCLSFEHADRPTPEDVHEWLVDLLHTYDKDGVEPPELPPIPDFTSDTNYDGTTDNFNDTMTHKSFADIFSPIFSPPTATTPDDPSCRFGPYANRISGHTLQMDVECLNSNEDRVQNGSITSNGFTRESSRKKLDMEEERQVIRSRHELREGATETVIKSGSLLKRNTKGLRYWKEAWFVLTDMHLRWSKSVTDHTVRGQISLRGSRLNPTKEFRWQILDTRGSVDSAGDHSLFNRELSATSQAEMISWMTAIQKAIDSLPDPAVTAIKRHHVAASTANLRSMLPSKLPLSAQRMFQMLSSASSGSSFSFSASGDSHSELSRDEMESVTSSLASLSLPSRIRHSKKPQLWDLYQDVEDWLKALHLPVDRYLTAFQRETLTDLKDISENGLGSDILDRLNVTHPLHRRVLASAAVTCFTQYVLISVSDWRVIGPGQPTTFKVVSRWRFHRSNRYLTLTDFVELDAAVRLAVNVSAQSNIFVQLKRIPTLPARVLGYVNHIDPILLASRRAELENYLHRVADALTGTSVLPVLLDRLGLVHDTPTISYEKLSGKASSVIASRSEKLMSSPSLSLSPQYLVNSDKSPITNPRQRSSSDTESPRSRHSGDGSRRSFGDDSLIVLDSCAYSNVESPTSNRNGGVGKAKHSRPKSLGMDIRYTSDDLTEIGDGNSRNGGLLNR